MEKKIETVRAVERALDILLSFSKDEPCLSLPEICKKIGLPKSTVYRLISTLQLKGFIEQNEINGKYQPGTKLISISNILLKNMDLRKIAFPVMCGLRDASGETVNLYILRNRKRVCIEQVEGSHLIKRYAAIGDELPLHCGASGKLLLAFQPESEIDRVIEETGLKPWTEKSITDPVLLKKNLENIRNQGYAFTKGERETGAASIAAPIRNHTGNVVAAVTISGPDSRFTPENAERYITLVTEAARKISKNLGYT
ncbi:MAG: IclR family transcriptional regulator [Firmicutes bacterium]|jgi:DNA-binding IclR family transcriptional regulator|nr:IclR family transcriptional regulator [Bacillota bacterium]